MAWIKTVDPDEATGLLGTIYEQSRIRTGKVFNIVRLQSLHPRVLGSSLQLYLELMHAPDNELDRAQREMIAVVVSRTNECFY